MDDRRCRPVDAFAGARGSSSIPEPVDPTTIHRRDYEFVEANGCSASGSIRFEGARWSGHIDCNGSHGRWKVAADEISMVVDLSSRAQCVGANFVRLDSLSSIDGIDDDRVLRFRDADGFTLAVARRR